MNQTEMDWAPPKRGVDDFVPTPTVATLALLETLPPPKDRMLLEPAAGGGAILQVLIDRGWAPERLHAKELRKCERPYLEQILSPSRVQICDWFDVELSLAPVNVTNPPFSRLPAWIAHTFKVSRNLEYLALLMPISELAGKQSSARVFKAHPPTGIVPIPWRPWYGVRGVAWVVWEAGKPPAAIHFV